MDEVTEASSDTALATVEPAAGLPEVRDGGELAVYRPSSVPPGVEVIAGLLGVLLVFKASVDVADEMVVVVVADDDLLDLAVLAHFAEEVLVEGVKVVLQLRRIHLVLRVERRVLVQVWQQDRLAIRRLHVFPRAPVPVPACTNLVIERACLPLPKRKTRKKKR